MIHQELNLQLSISYQEHLNYLKQKRGPTKEVIKEIEEAKNTLLKEEDVSYDV